MKVLSLIFCLLLIGCTATRVSRETYEVQQAASINPKSQYLKVHLNNGSVYVLNSWSIITSESRVVGNGSLLDHNRQPLLTSRTAPFEIPFSDVALFETNDPGNNINHGLVLVSLVTLGFTINCIANPKSCFGSCPTFYALGPAGPELMAEGFSRSISPQLEETDLDMLYGIVPRPGEDLKITVTNEALETHYIKSIALAAVPKGAADRVFKDSQGKFWQMSNLSQPLSSNASDVDILTKLAAFDNNEWFDYTDSTNLAKKVEIEFTFKNEENGSMGLVLAKRQSLLTTYLFYQTLSYMGHSAAHWLTEMQRGNFQYDYDGKGIYRELGGIEVFEFNDSNEWVKVELLKEAGPIATDVDVISLPPVTSNERRIKLRMTKGMWRINYLALGNIEGEAKPLALEMTAVVDENNSERDDVLLELLDEEDYLMTYPGDEYHLMFDVPDEPGAYEYFINSTGYYLEWMREEWVKEQNLKKLWQALHRPKRYLRKEAATYKSMELSMEQVFWNSRYVKK